ITVLKGLQVVATHPEVDVLNLSLSSGSPLPYEVDPLTVALESLWRQGITVVVPAGNDGADGQGSITSPGVDPVLLTVGGLDEHGTAARGDDSVASWSSQGPAPQHVAKPDLVAPGAHLVSTADPGSQVWTDNPGARVGDAYFVGSGTSFATAVTSGAAAVLEAARPSLTPDQVKALATGTAYATPGTAWTAGAGGLDLAAALDAPAPAASTPRSRGRAAASDAVLSDSANAWAAYLQALLDDDAVAAANAWAQLSPEARQWAARQWAGLDEAARQWAARQWAARQWAGDPAVWAARQWAARQWAARQWADSDWAARQWSARQWSARQWSADDWSARQWSARQWSARQWSATGWS
ncbi:MAG: S8 family serine peptidase, partial [Mycobacteriales bacterium]